MQLDGTNLLALVKDDLLPQFQKERDRLHRLDRWLRWDHDKPHAPRHSTNEYRELATRAQAPWLGLVVTSVVQALYVEGYRRSDATEDAPAWRIWQQNGFDSRQVAIHHAAVAFGHSYVTVLPGALRSGESVPVMRGVSPRRMLAFYEDPAEDDWPAIAMQGIPAKVDGNNGWRLKVYDDELIHVLEVSDLGDTKVTKVGEQTHGIGWVPVVRYANALDLDGRTDGEVEPFIPIAARIDQTAFDRLVVQRFASWVVRTIAGMAKPEDPTDTAAEKLRLKVEDILVAEDPDTKFGSLPATPLDGFIAAHEADVKVLAAVSQTPAHELLGSLANMSAEALAAARASATAKIDQRKHSFGESHEQALRLAAIVAGDTAGASDFEAQVRWKDTEIRSLAQAADALGKLAQMLGVPVELLWEKIPGFTQQDVDAAKVLVDQAGGMDALLATLQGGQEPPNLAVA